MSAENRLLTRLAVVGACAMALRYTWAAGPRPWTEPLYALLAMALGLFVLFALARSGRRRLAANPTTLVPLGVVELVHTLLLQLPAQAANFDFANLPGLFEAHPTALAMLAAALLLHVFGTVWQTLVIVQVLDGRPADPAGALRATPRHLPRGAAILLIVYVALFSIPIAAMASGLPAEAPAVTLSMMPVASIGLSLATALWLPRVLDRRQPLLRAIGEATRVSLMRWRLSLGLLLAWSLAAGVVTVHFVESYTATSHTTSTSWSFLTKYYAAYPFDSGWYHELPLTAGIPTLAWYAVPLAWLYAATAVAVKLEILIRHRDAENPDDDAHPHESDVRRRSRRAAALARVRRRMARDRAD